MGGLLFIMARSRMVDLREFVDEIRAIIGGSGWACRGLRLGEHLLIIGGEGHRFCSEASHEIFDTGEESPQVKPGFESLAIIADPVQFRLQPGGLEALFIFPQAGLAEIIGRNGIDESFCRQ
jgi:hypothetical protein